MQDIPEPEKEAEVGPTVKTQPFELEIDDKELADILDKKIKKSNDFYKDELKLDTRRKENENFWLGKQLDESKFYDWQTPFKDNIIYQDLETRIAIAASRMPDIIVTPSDMAPEKISNAKLIERVLDLKVKSDTTKRMIKDGLRNLHLYLNAAIKCRWDKNRGENGDFYFELVRPHRLVLDHTANYPHDGFTADNMDFVVETIEEPLSLILKKFPTKRDELFIALSIVKGTSAQMISKLKYQEVWFTWYGKEGEILEGVFWKYKKIILGKGKHPYYDLEGHSKTDENGQVVEGTFYNNHFDRPRKPYIFFTHQNLGRSPIDDTSPVEQSITLQKTINKQGRQITDISERAVPKLAFSGRYIDREQVRRITNDPDEHIWLKDAENVNQAITSIAAQPPSQTLLQVMLQNRSQIDSKFATHSTTRGEQIPNESGVSKQITREGDLTISDDIVNITVERVVYEMANWAVQMMKVMYDKSHFIKDLGKDGEVANIELKRDLIDDGIAVNVKASSVDKAQRRADALNLAGQKGIDPLSLIEDLDMPNPKERTKRLVLFLQGDYQGYLNAVGIKTEQPQGQASASGEDQGRQQAVLDIQRLEVGEDFEPTQPTAEYVQALVEYINSDQFAQQPPEIQIRFKEFIGKLRGSIEQQPPIETPPEVV